MNPPMVPAVVVHCIKEVERKGSVEIGIYRVPGSEKDVKALKVRLVFVQGLMRQGYFELVGYYFSNIEKS